MPGIWQVLSIQYIVRVHAIKTLVMTRRCQGESYAMINLRRSWRDGLYHDSVPGNWDNRGLI